MARRLTIVAVLYALLAGASWIVPEAHSLRDPLGLMSYAFMLIAAYVAGDLAERFGIPRVTAYLLTGVASGPYIADLVSAESVGATHYFPSSLPVAPFALLALGLSALRAGSALRLSDLRGQRRAATLTLGLTTLAVPIAVAAAIMGAVELRLLELPGASREHLPSLLLAGLVAGFVALGASPLSTVAVVDEGRARGPVSTLAHALSLSRELLALVLVLVALAFIPNAHAGHRALGLLLSLGAGALIAGLILALRAVAGRDSPLGTLAVILAAGAALAIWAVPSVEGEPPWSAPWGPLVAFLVAGALLGGARKAGPRALSAIAPLTTPAYVLFFTAVGAAFPFTDVAVAVPLALAIAGARALAILFAGRVISRTTSGAEHAARGAGGSLSFAGVSIALAYIVGEAAPTWGLVLRDALLGAIFLSELIGPLVLRLYLTRAAEIALPGAADREVAAAKRLLERDAIYGVDLPTPPEDLPPELREPLLNLRDRAQDEMELFAETLAEALAQGPFAFVSEIAHGPDERVDALQVAYDRCSAFAGRASTLQLLNGAIERLLSNIDKIVAGVRPTSVPERPVDRLPRPRDGRLVRLRKLSRRLAARLGLRRRARRVVRLDRLAAYELSMPLPARLVPVANLALRAPVMALEEVRRAVLDHEDPHEAAPENLLRLGDEVLARAMLLFADAMDALYDAAARAGTPSLSEWRTRPSRRFQESRAGRAQLVADAARWDRLTRGYAGRLEALIQVELVEPRIEARYEAAADELRATLEAALVAPLGTMVAGVEGALPAVAALLDAGSAPDPLALRAIGEDLRERAAAALRELDERASRGELSKLLTPLLAELERLCQEIPERLVVPAARTSLPPEGLAPGPEAEESAELRAQEIALAMVVEDARLHLAEVEERVDALVEETRAAMTQALQLEDFHLGAAADELAARETAHPEDLAREFAMGGLARLHERLAEEARLLGEKIQAIAEPVLAESARSRAGLRRLLYEVPPDVAHAQAKRARIAGEEFVERSTRRAAAARWIGKRLAPLGAFVGESKRAQPAPGGFPFEVAAQASLSALSGLKLPQSYLRLFSTNPVGIDAFFAGHDHAWDTLQGAIARWRRGEPTAVVVVGGRGVGVSSLIERALRHLPEGITVGRVSLTPRRESARELTRAIGAALGNKRLSSVSRIEEHLLALRRPAVLIVEPLGRTHLRHRGGLEGLRLLRRLIGATAHKILWIVGTDPLALDAVDGLVSVSDAFTHQLRLGPLDASELARLIEARHQASGYLTRYISPGGATGLDPKEARDRFFAALAERAEGRPLIAVFEWLRALNAHPDGQTLVAELAPALDLSYIDRVPLADLITLALVHVHGGLTPSELATVARVTPGDADETLRRLAWRHLVEPSPGGHYAINPVIWPRLSHRLRARGIA